MKEHISSDNIRIRVLYIITTLTMRLKGLKNGCLIILKLRQDRLDIFPLKNRVKGKMI